MSKYELTSSGILRINGDVLSLIRNNDINTYYCIQELMMEIVFHSLHKYRYMLGTEALFYCKHSHILL